MTEVVAAGFPGAAASSALRQSWLVTGRASRSAAFR
jgi:hypothetical protein